MANTTKRPANFVFLIEAEILKNALRFFILTISVSELENSFKCQMGDRLKKKLKHPKRITKTVFFTNILTFPHRSRKIPPRISRENPTAAETGWHGLHIQRKKPPHKPVVS